MYYVVCIIIIALFIIGGFVLTTGVAGAEPIRKVEITDMDWGKELGVIWHSMDKETWYRQEFDYYVVYKNCDYDNPVKAPEENYGAYTLSCHEGAPLERVQLSGLIEGVPEGYVITYITGYPPTKRELNWAIYGNSEIEFVPSKAQMKGVLDRFDNILDVGRTTDQNNTTLGGMYRDRLELKAIIEYIQGIVKEHEFEE